MNKQIITADHLNATHLGKRITINSLHGTVVSGKLKEISADYAIMPSLASYFPYKTPRRSLNQLERAGIGRIRATAHEQHAAPAWSYARV